MIAALHWFTDTFTMRIGHLTILLLVVFAATIEANLDVASEKKWLRYWRRIAKLYCGHFCKTNIVKTNEDKVRGCDRDDDSSQLYGECNCCIGYEVMNSSSPSCLLQEFTDSDEIQCQSKARKFCNRNPKICWCSDFCYDCIYRQDNNSTAIGCCRFSRSNYYEACNECIGYKTMSSSTYAKNLAWQGRQTEEIEYPCIVLEPYYYFG